MIEGAQIKMCSAPHPGEAIDWSKVKIVTMLGNDRRNGHRPPPPERSGGLRWNGTNWVKA